MAVYVFKKGVGFVDKHTGEPMPPSDTKIYEARINFISEIQPYKSPASGKMITSRSEAREDLKATNCRVADPSEFKSVYRNPKFREKHKIPESKWGDPLAKPVREKTELPQGFNPERFTG